MNLSRQDWLVVPAGSKNWRMNPVSTCRAVDGYQNPSAGADVARGVKRSFRKKYAKTLILDPLFIWFRSTMGHAIPVCRLMSLIWTTVRTRIVSKALGLSLHSIAQGSLAGPATGKILDQRKP